MFYIDLKNTKKKSSGFTLIELLVVIAIIGVLSSVVMASLNLSRQKAKDAAIVEIMKNIRVQSAIHYDSQNPVQYGTTDSVGNDCDDAGTLFSDPNILLGINSLVSEVPGGAAGMQCDASDQTWAVSVNLNLGQVWCTDYRGISELKGTLLGTYLDCSY
jgi:prepilin-type N-terminal cleavage/methylation domain-containing protein